MTDIVERLRKLESVERELAHECDMPPEGTANWGYAETCREAADEITRLRAALQKRQEARVAKMDDFPIPPKVMKAFDDCILHQPITGWRERLILTIIKAWPGARRDKLPGHVREYIILPIPVAKKVKKP